MSLKDTRHTTKAEKPVDWIVVGANIFGLLVVLAAAVHAQADGPFKQIASQAASGTIF
ncbi:MULTISPECIES: hypothetical protein [Sulfitobacter]|uniref:Uncharacterized protein n=1 Tax=Sulfitobacter dubius TaxID=218673 RepID=A0ABY3ZR18_9RHOB|nr:hypothetical protein [Sulfitobacter dubius]UOA16106.1 hypothetical protein DSM109990_02963 [Sulfitobacter dubius]WOI28541.1 hypothetical protein R1T39_12745 [Sulfitobacter dubius]